MAISQGAPGNAVSVTQPSVWIGLAQMVPGLRLEPRFMAALPTSGDLFSLGGLTASGQLARDLGLIAHSFHF